MSFKTFQFIMRIKDTKFRERAGISLASVTTTTYKRLLVRDLEENKPSN